ncbi:MULTISPECIES: YhfC family intramembrane metalloprotease [Neobacillus]|uniref:YhfC family intramembrane metalloprotease n=1 Tax=Neobacillus sedimentimangrovi TaxID=2699460 RepID=A0ABS8QEE1_9BACI|nr:YhfC family glutamic-type intramembrane protease [Neobacillus sedimentimangrovi]AIM16904.1 hypothetical protein HW35_12210 [Bacillus sp. X1(2014)]MCD4837492.1 YhfC family intramembrane metalloprotease [Neobacillus sedimentimangrovi]
MVSSATLASMVAMIVFSMVLFIGLIWFYRKRTGIAIKPMIVGAVGFVVFTQILEKVLHVAVITKFPNYAEHPWAFGTYGALAAGVFEELGRFLLFVWLLKKYHDYKSGISFGIGWGGIEAILLSLIIAGQRIILSLLLNAGVLEAAVGAQFPADQLAAVKDELVSKGASFYLLGSLERFFAVFIQIALSLLVLIGVVKKRFSLVVLAILIHAAIDFPVVFFQTGHIKQLWIIEVYVAMIGILSFFFIKKARTFLPDIPTKS